MQYKMKQWNANQKTFKQMGHDIFRYKGHDFIQYQEREYIGLNIRYDRATLGLLPLSDTPPILYAVWGGDVLTREQIVQRWK